MGRFVKNPILAGEDSIQIPVGTTAERPASPKKGMLRFNTTDSSFEGYNGNEWGAITGASTSTHLQKGPIIEVLSITYFL